MIIIYGRDQNNYHYLHIHCIKSAKLLTNKVIVIDMESQDNTVEIAKSLGVTIYQFPHADYVEPAREFGINKAETD